jgi:hypothetical protein
MARAEAAIFAALTSLVSGRVFPDVLPQGVAYPAIRYQRISTSRGRIGACSRGHPGELVRDFRSTFGPFRNPKRLRSLKTSVSLDGFNGVSGGPQIDAVAIEDEDSGYEPDIGPNGAGVYRMRQDYFISHVE